MAILLLNTKLYPPPARANQVARARLTAFLDDALRRGRRLTLICAPAGSGKTTLLADWLSTKDEGGRMKDEGTQQSLHPSGYAQCIHSR